MSTRSSIAMLEKDGTVRMTTIHWDGYITGVGYTLVHDYSDFDKTERLINLGAISSLGKHVEASELTKRFGFDGRFTHEYEKLSKKEQKRLDKDDRSYTVAYHRDRGEELVLRKFKSIPAYLNGLKHYGQEYDYFLGRDKDLNPQWYLVLETGFKALYCDEEVSNVMNCLEVNPERINIADIFKSEDDSYCDPKKFNDRLRKIKVKNIIAFLDQFQQAYNLGTPLIDQFGPNQYKARFTSTANHYDDRVQITLKDPDTNEDRGFSLMVDAINTREAIPRQVLRWLLVDLDRYFKAQAPKYKLEEVPKLQKLLAIKEKIANFYRTKVKYDPDSIAFKYFLYLCCKEAEDASGYDPEYFNIMVKAYVKKRVDKFFKTEFGTALDDLTPKDVANLIEKRGTGYDAKSPYESYLAMLIRNVNPSDPNLFVDPKDSSALYRIIYSNYKNLVARDTENTLIQAEQFASK